MKVKEYKMLLNEHPDAIRGKHVAPVILKRPVSRWQLVGGSRLRVEEAIEHLKLNNLERLDVIVEDGKKREVGRVKVVEGYYYYPYDKNTYGVRLLVAETQMGMPAVDIVARELIFAAKKEPVVQIRVGTCGGINTQELDHPILGIGDLVIAQKVIGSSGAIMQQMGYFPSILNPNEDKKDLFKFIDNWQRLGGEFALDGKFLALRNDLVVVSALRNAADRLVFSYHVGNAFSKESLYAEGQEELMIELRKKENVLITEMEQLQHAFLAHFAKAKYGLRVFTGMIAAVIGAVPGEGFPTDKKGFEKQQEAERQALKVGALALGFLHKWLRSDGKSEWI
jgi:uridine phosphorylase